MKTKCHEEPPASSWIRDLKQSGAQETGLFVFMRYSKADIKTARVAIIVSRKIGNSVVRNKIKRRLREISRKFMREALAPGYYLLIARTAIVKVDFGHLQEDILELVEKLSRDKK